MKLQNGCICCTLRLDLLCEIKTLCETHNFDYLIIESTGIAEPMQVAETFEFDPTTNTTAEENGTPLALYAQLDTLVTVVDLSMMKRNIASIESIESAYQEGVGEAEGEKKIGQLLIDQLEFANVIILNKCDVVSSVDIEVAKTLISKLNPDAKIICSTFSRVDLHEIMNTKMFSMEKAREAAGWLADLRNSELQKSESEEYGVVSFIYQARRPFHPQRLNSWVNKYFVAHGPSNSTFSDNELQVHSDERFTIMESEIGWIARSKGFVWLATRGQTMCVWNHGGRLLELNSSIDWLIETPESEWGVPKEDIQSIKNGFVGKHGDKRQEIVFIGIGLKTDAITSGLNSCLLTDEEFQLKESAWGRFYDPLPPWPIQPGMWTQTMISDTTSMLNIPPNMELEITLVSLEEGPNNPPSMNPVPCQVYLASKFKEHLLCTLRPGFTDQFYLNLRVHGPYQELRIQSAVPESVHFIHFFGYASVEEDDDAEDMETEEH